MKKLSVLIVSTSDGRGGAFAAAYRLQKSLLLENVDSKMLVMNKSRKDPYIITSASRLVACITRFRPIIDRLAVKLYVKRSKTPFSPSYFRLNNIIKYINSIECDIVHLHWIQGGMLSISDIGKIKKPTVWSLHDMWAFTGGCHYDEECGLYISKCGNCKVLNSKNERDLSRLIMNKKYRNYKKNKNLTIVGLSNWLTKCAQNSSLFKHNNIINLPNPINTTVFKPIEKNLAKQLIDLTSEKKMILFGSMGSQKDPRKGFSKLLEAVKKLSYRKDIEIIVFGNDESFEQLDIPFKIRFFEELNDDLSIRILYNASDVTVIPSLQENLSNTILESLSCGTPVVAFDIGGNSDMIQHKINGYLANQGDSQDLANGIQWVLDNSNPANLIANARNMVMNQFEQKKIAKKYVELYNNILTNTSK